MNRPIYLKPFDDQDWNIWAGAECPKNGEPLISEIKLKRISGDYTGIVIIDANRITIQSEESIPIAAINVPYPVGILVAHQLISDHVYTNKELASLGFTLLSRSKQ
jgi:hypothetical protein